MVGKKRSKFDKSGIADLAKDRPVVYDILNKTGGIEYTGKAKRGRVEARLKEHLPGARDAIKNGSQVKIRQYPSIGDASKAEKRRIKSKKPPQNKIGK